MDDEQCEKCRLEGGWTNRKQAWQKGKNYRWVICEEKIVLYSADNLYALSNYQLAKNGIIINYYHSHHAVMTIRWTLRFALIT
jgi:hypothetical protein